jgi:hypothetical protein
MELDVDDPLYKEASQIVHLLKHLPSSDAIKFVMKILKQYERETTSLRRQG